MPPPTAERLKVRCYRCNQLLAVAPNKAGTVVACPKCKADLLIPRPEPRSTAEPSDPSVAPLKSDTYPALNPVTESAAAAGRPGPPSPSFLEEIAAIIPPEVAALRPEDLRVEAEVFETITRQPSPPPVDEPFSFPTPLTAADLIPPSPPVEMPPPAAAEGPPITAAAGPAAVAPGPVVAPPPLPISAPAHAPEPNVVVPPIRLEAEPIRPSDADAPRPLREVVLPASVVLAWSLFVLLAIPMAFLAGLMIGHFLWRTGP